MSIKNSFATAANFDKQAALYRKIQQDEATDRIVAVAFRQAKDNLKSLGCDLTFDSPKKELKELAKGVYNGSFKATLGANTEAGMKRVAINFNVKESVATLVETPEQITAALDNQKSDLDLAIQAQMERIGKQQEKLKAEAEINAKIMADLYAGKSYKEAMERNSPLTKTAGKEYIQADVEGAAGGIGSAPEMYIKVGRATLPSTMKIGDTLNVSGAVYEYFQDEVSKDGSDNATQVTLRLVVK